MDARAETITLLLAMSTAAFGQCSTMTVGAHPVSSVSARAESPTVTVGSPVLIEAVRTNISDHNISVWREQRGSYVVDITDETGKRAPDKRPYFRDGRLDPSLVKQGDAASLSGSGACITLKPGESFRERIDVARLNDLTRPGRYTIVIEMDDPESTMAVRSAPITVVMSP